MGLLGGANPLASIGKTIDQFKRGVNDFLAAVENFNRTMETVNGIATRANALFDEIEEPLKAFMPQVTRSIKAADAVINQLSGPVEKVAPGINRLAETLSNPVFASMPTEIANFLDTFGDVARRLQPLALMAENAGNMFGFRSLLGGGSSPAPAPAPAPPRVVTTPPPPPAPVEPATKAPVKKAAAKKTAAKKTPAKKTAAKKAPAKKTAAKKTAAKQAAPKR